MKQYDSNEPSKIIGTTAKTPVEDTQYQGNQKQQQVPWYKQTFHNPERITHTNNQPGQACS